MLLTDHISAFVTALTANGLSPKTVDWYACNLRDFMRFCDGDRVTTPLLRDFVVALQARNLSSATVHGYLRTLKRFFNWCIAEQLTTENPVQRIAMPRLPKRVPRGVTAEDFARLVETCTPNDWLNVRDRALLLLLRDTGCRASEIAGLCVSNLELEKGFLLVCGKGRQERFVFVSRATIEAVHQWLSVRNSNADALFTARHGGTFSAMTLSQMLRRRKRQAGILGRVNPHSFRHGFARDWLRSGGDLASLSQTLGHRDLQTTMIYSTLCVADLQAKHARHSPLAIPVPTDS